MDTWSSIISKADLEGQGLGTTQLLQVYVHYMYIHIPNVCTNTLLVHMYESGDVSWNK